jgi:hypothetical protein
LDELTPDLAVQNSNLDEVHNDLAVQNSNLDEISNDLAVQNSNLDEVHNDLAVQNTNLDELTPDLAVQNSNLDEVHNDLAVQNSNLDEISNDLAVQNPPEDEAQAPEKEKLVSVLEPKPAENTITQDSKTKDMLFDFAVQDHELESFAKSADNAAQNGGSVAHGDLDLDGFANPKADDLFVNSTANHDDNDILASDTTIDRYAELVKTIQNSIEFMQTTQTQFNTIQNLANDLPNSSPSTKVNFDYDRERSYMDKLRDKLFDDDRERVKVSADVKEEVVRKFAYLKTKIAAESANYSKWESKSKKWALFFQILTATLAGIVTIILGIKLSNQEVVWWLNTIALVMTVSISILGVVQRFFDADEKYAKYQDTHYKLQLLLNDIEYLELGIDYVTLADANALQAEFSRILASTYEYEMQLITSDDREVNKIKQQGIAK